MTYDIRQKHYESRHVQEFLEIDKNQLFHWVQTKRLIEPAKLGIGRGGRSQFSFNNLLDLALIKELSEFGVELNAIDLILKGKSFVIKTDDSDPEKGIVTKGRSTWEIFKEKREKYEKENLYLDIYRIGNRYHWNYWTGLGRKKWIEGSVVTDKTWVPKAVLTVDISGLIIELEAKTRKGL